MKSLWHDAEIRSKDSLDQLVYRSRLLGLETRLCVWGGGNTSTKRTERDHLGRQTRVLWVKGSGSDLKASERKDFSPLRLDDLTPLLKRKDMSDEEMVALVARSQMDPKAPRASIEALLHAFLPFPDIDHSHADAILSVTNTKRGAKIARDIYGDELLWIPYVKPGFRLAKLIFDSYQKNKEAKGAILENHGLITWGDSSKESYGRMIRFVSQAENRIHQKTRGRRPFGQAVHSNLSTKDREEWLVQNLPVIRKAVSRGKPVVLKTSSTPAALEFVNAILGPDVSQAGPATPDHMLRTKRIPLFFDLTRPLETQIERYAKSHEQYYRMFNDHALPMLDPYPRVMLVPGVGLITTGKDMDAASQCAEIYEHSIAAMQGAQTLGRYQSLSPGRAFEVEYWPLELYKLSLLPPEKPLARRVAIVTGAGGSIGQAIAERLLKDGMHVALCDLNHEKMVRLAEGYSAKLGTSRAIGLKMDVTKETDVIRTFRDTVLAYGGLDLVVSNAGIAHIASVDMLSLGDWEKSIGVNATGHFLVAREAVRLFKRQGMGGNLVFIATKNVLAPGKDFGAYSASKSAEAQLARVCAIEGGEFGIRSNMVNPDSVFEGSGLWSADVRKERAKSYGIPTDRLEDFYRNRNLLKTKILPSDVASSVAFLASAESAKTTGCILTVDGGVREAFPR